MPAAFPIEFRRDVVAVARNGEAPLAQIAKNFGISGSCLPSLEADQATALQAAYGLQ